MEDSKTVWKKIFGWKIGDAVSFQSISPKPGHITTYYGWITLIRSTKQNDWIVANIAVVKIVDWKGIVDTHKAIFRAPINELNVWNNPPKMEPEVKELILLESGIRF